MGAGQHDGIEWRRFRKDGRISPFARGNQGSGRDTLDKPASGGERNLFGFCPLDYASRLLNAIYVKEGSIWV